MSRWRWSIVPCRAAERRERVAAALALTGLTEFAAAYPKQLSGGMRQRVGIARALVVRPAVLLLDEPLSALDAQTRELLMEDLLAIWAREKSTRVYVTHNLEEAARLADRVVVLSRRPGRIREILRIDVPRRRARPARARGVLLAEMHRRLWSLIRDEARPPTARCSVSERQPRALPRRRLRSGAAPRLLPWIVFAVLIALWQAAVAAAACCRRSSCRARSPS